MDDAPEDTELLQRYVADGSQEAFGALVGKYLPLIYSAALRQLEGNASSAEDAAQLVFALLARRARSLVRHPALSGWLYTSTFHVSRRMLRSERRQRRRELKAVGESEAGPEPDASVEWASVRPVLDRAMLELAEEDRMAVLFRFFEGKSYREIGSRLGLAENAARMRIDRALDRLQGNLSKYGVTSTAAAIGLALSSEAVGAVPATLAASVMAGAAAAPAAAGWILLMSSTTAKIVTGAVLAGSLVGLAVQHRTLARQRNELSQLRAVGADRDVRQQRRIADLQGQLAAAGSVQANRSRSGAAAEDPNLVLLRRHPEYLTLLRHQVRRRVLGLYAAGLAKLSLPPDKLERLKELLTDRGLAGMDFSQASAAAGLKPGTPAFREAIRQTDQQIAGQISDLIGADGLAQLDYQRSLSQTTEAVRNDFQPEFADAGVPLSGDQIDRLSKFLNDEAAPHLLAAKGISTTVDPSTGLSPAQSLTLSGAGDILSPEQVQVFRNHTVEDNERQAIMADTFGTARP